MPLSRPELTEEVLCRAWGPITDEYDHRAMCSIVMDLYNCPRVFVGIQRMAKDMPDGQWLYELIALARECMRESRNRYLRQYAAVGSTARRPRW